MRSPKRRSALLLNSASPSAGKEGAGTRPACARAGQAPQAAKTDNTNTPSSKAAMLLKTGCSFSFDTNSAQEILLRIAQE